MIRRTLPLAFILLLAACGHEEFQDLQDFVKNSGANMRGKVPPPPEIKPHESFTYDNSTGLPDPFKPRKDIKKAERPGLNQPDLEGPREPLEEFPLESLRMVGFLHQGKASYGIIRSPDNKLHRIKAGNYLGQNFASRRGCGHQRYRRYRQADRGARQEAAVAQHVSPTF